MKILVIDKEKENLLSIKKTFEEERGFHVDLSYSYEETTSFLNNNKYEFIIIDFNIPSGNEILEAILKDNKKQKIITLSEINGVSEKKGCDYCIENFNKRRLVKKCTPQDILNIIDIFDDFTCYFKNKFAE
ncbi:MAG: response regulator [Arcobacteraceae bacterium]|nr:response regulator [Arcobacteraceae bacterium]